MLVIVKVEHKERSFQKEIIINNDLIGVDESEVLDKVFDKIKKDIIKLKEEN